MPYSGKVKINKILSVILFVHCIFWLFRRKEMFYLTHFIYGYVAFDMVEDHSDSERGNPLPPHGLLFVISNKDSFICTIPQTR